MTQQGFTIFPIPFLQSSNSHVEINCNHLLVNPCDPNDDIVNMYTKMTSNIIVPGGDKKLKLVN